MSSGKIDEQLELALQVPKEVLTQDENLAAGYDEKENKWELIVKYVGDIQNIANELGIVVEILSYGYAIVIVDENMIERLAEYDEIIYIEKPRALTFSINNARTVSCINGLQNPNSLELLGEGVIVAIIDSGIDYSHLDFRHENGKTRIISIWDQTVTKGTPPKGFIFGTEYSREQLNQALNQPTKEEQLNIVNSVDVSGHGTHVAGIACGNGITSKGLYKGVASKSDILVVKIGNSIGESYPKTTRIMEALEYAIQVAIRENKPIAINLSFGNNYGDHGGRNILEQYIDEIAMTWKNSICVGTGNEGNERKHIGKNILIDNSTNELLIGPSQGYISLQIWKYYQDNFIINILSPSEKRIEINKYINETATYEIENTTIYGYYGQPNPISTIQEINIIFYPNSRYLEEGIWKIEMIPVEIVDGGYDIWLGSSIILNSGTGFLQPTKYKTLTIPSTSYRAITVGAYNGMTDSYALFSGVGSIEYGVVGKPDIVAPGVDIISTSVGGGYISRTGTSMATPIVTGSTALLLEWGIVRDNDRFLYGEKIKAYLIKGARHLKEFTTYPNPFIGWGALCLEDSLPG